MELKCVFGTMECVFNVLSRAQQSRAEHGSEERTGAEQRRAHTPVQLVVCASNNTCINPLTAYGLVVVHPQSTRPLTRPEIPIQLLFGRHLWHGALPRSYSNSLLSPPTPTPMRAFKFLFAFSISFAWRNFSCFVCFILCGVVENTFV